MLYEVITRDVSLAICDLNVGVLYFLGLSSLAVYGRITSYNVCYTKLLRDGGRGAGAGPVRPSDALRALPHRQPPRLALV